jgi:hypothetical protein
MTINRINGSIWNDSRGSDVFPQIRVRGIIINDIISVSDTSYDSMMKRCNQRGHISRASYNSGTEGVKTRDDIIYIIRGVLFRIILLSILP